MAVDPRSRRRPVGGGTARRAPIAARTDPPGGPTPDPTGPQELPDTFWEHAPLRAALEHRHMGRVIREFRLHPFHGHRPLSQERVAEWLGITQAQLSRIENGAPIVHLDRLIQVARILRIPDEQLWYSLPRRGGERAGPRPAEAAQAPFPRADRAVALSHPAWPQEPSLPLLLDSPIDIVRRMSSLGASTMDDFTVAEMENLVVEVIADYERIGPVAVGPGLVAQRRWLHECLLERHPPRIGVRLYSLAAHMSGILASVALDVRSFSMARSYAAEAFQLADLVGDPELGAWVRGTQSLIEYYAGRYQLAVDLARDGLRRSPRGAQSIRLTVNGEARALARLGDTAGVDAAVDRAVALHESLPQTPELSASLDVGPYCAARIHGNAATAYLTLGRSASVLDHGQWALEVFDPRELQGPRALTRLDMATALLGSDQADPARAAALAVEAVGLPGADGFAAVLQRAGEFLAAAEPFRTVPEMRAASERISTLTPPTLEVLDPGGGADG